MEQRQSDQFIQADFFNNAGGLNLTDSPIRVRDEQATGGYNYEYGLTGGFRKRLGHTKLNSSANTQLQALGYSLHADVANVKTVIRKAGTKIQSVNTSTGAATNLTEDTATAGTDFTPSSQKIPSLFSSYTTTTNTQLWTAGSNATAIYAVYSPTKVTKNGADVPTGVLSTSVAGAGGAFGATGTYYYAAVLHKLSTGVLSNAALDVSATVAATTDEVTITLTGITGLDTTKYDKIYIYRSAVAGVTGFTTGDLIAQVASTASTYVDKGAFLTTATNVPRAGNIILDNSTLPSGTFNALTVFKRRLVTAINSTVYISDVNKPESWPLTNNITIPSGGPITGVAIISFTTPTSTGIEEILAIYKENELWVITGSTFSDFALKKIDTCGAINQSVIVTANGYLAWFDYRGFYLWDGSGKPIYCSRPIEFQFSPDGSIDKTKFSYAWGSFHKRTNQIKWYLSDSMLGEQKYCLKLDVRLTLPQIESTLQGRILEGVFIQDKTEIPMYGGSSFFPDSQEAFFAGDASGNTYKLYDGVSDAGGGIDFEYETKILDFGQPTKVKRIHKIVVWIEDSTDANLTLDFWTGYNVNDSQKATLSLPISRRVTRAVWDLAYWDLAEWDSNQRTYSPLVFNVYSPRGSEGEAFKLRIKQADANAPVSIAGISIFYTIMGLRI